MNPRPFDLESNALSTWPHAPIYMTSYWFNSPSTRKNIAYISASMQPSIIDQIRHALHCTAQRCVEYSLYMNYAICMNQTPDLWVMNPIPYPLSSVLMGFHPAGGFEVTGERGRILSNFIFRVVYLSSHDEWMKGWKIILVAQAPFWGAIVHTYSARSSPKKC